MKLVIDVDEDARTGSAKVATCSDCKYFLQHYIKTDMPNWMTDHGYTKANAGHCIFPRIKNREPGTLACKYFELKE